MWMNEYEIEEAELRWRDHPVMGPATYTLASLMAGVNRCSDGWAYWRVPARYAKRLTDLITAHEQWYRTEYQHPREGAEATPAALKAAYAQLRRFRTGHPSCQFRIKAATEGTTVPGDPEPVMVPSQPVPVTVRVSEHGRVVVLIDWPEGDIAPGTYEGGIDYVVTTPSGRKLDRAAIDALAEEA